MRGAWHYWSRRSANIRRCLDNRLDLIESRRPFLDIYHHAENMSDSPISFNDLTKWAKNHRVTYKSRCAKNSPYIFAYSSHKCQDAHQSGAKKKEKNTHHWFISHFFKSPARQHVFLVGVIGLTAFYFSRSNRIHRLKEIFLFRAKESHFIAHIGCWLVPERHTDDGGGWQQL